MFTNYIFIVPPWQSQMNGQFCKFAQGWPEFGNSPQITNLCLLCSSLEHKNGALYYFTLSTTNTTLITYVKNTLLLQFPLTNQL